MDDRPLYEKVADEIEAQVSKEVLRTGDKVPSIRHQSQASGVSINTVLQAYALLESRGVIESRPQSGFYVAAPRLVEDVRAETEIQESPAEVRIPDLISNIFATARGENFVPLGAAFLSESLYPNKALARITRSILRDNPEVNARYEFSPGAYRYRQQVAKRLSYWGHRVSPDDVVATNGAQEAVNLCLRALLKPGDTILIEAPNYFGNLQAIASLGLKVIEVPADARDGVNPDDLRKILKRYKIGAGLLLPNFNNPLGSLMPEDAKKEVVRLFASYRVPLIEDDVYGDLDLSGTRPRLLRSFDEDGMVLTCSSFSKTISPGSRCGWVIPGKFMDEVQRLQLSSTLGVNRLQQMVIAAFLASQSYERQLRKIRPLLSSQIQKMTEAVMDYFPEGTRVTQPRGGFMLWVEMPKAVDSVLLHQKAKLKKVSVAPGVIFSAGMSHRNYVRLNCGRIWTEEIDGAVKTLGQIAKRLMSGVHSELRR